MPLKQLITGASSALSNLKKAEAGIRERLADLAGTDRLDSRGGRLVAGYVDRILRGAGRQTCLFSAPLSLKLVINQDREGTRPNDPAVGTAAGGRGHTVA